MREIYNIICHNPKESTTTICCYVAVGLLLNKTILETCILYFCIAFSDLKKASAKWH